MPCIIDSTFYNKSEEGTVDSVISANLLIHNGKRAGRTEMTIYLILLLPVVDHVRLPDVPLDPIQLKPFLVAENQVSLLLRA